MKSLKDYVSLLEGSTHDDDREELKDDATCAREAENVDPEDVDIESDSDDVEEAISSESLTLESAIVAYNIIDVSCCEAYVMNPSESNLMNLNATMEASIKDVWEKIKAFFKKVWNKIVSWFNKIKMYVLSVFMNGEKFIAKYKSEIESKLSTLTERDITYDGYRFTDNPLNVGKRAQKGINDLMKEYKDFANSVENDETVFKQEVSVFNKTLKEFKEDPDFKPERMKEDFIRESYGQKTIFKVTPNIIRDEIKFVTTGKASLLKVVNDLSATITNVVRNLESLCKTLESKYNNEKKKASYTKAFSEVPNVISAINSAINGYSKLTAKYCNDRVSQAVVLCRKVLGGSAAKESFEYNGSGSVLESVMNII